MKKLSPIFAACLLGFCAVASATPYECTDRQGRRPPTPEPAAPAAQPAAPAAQPAVSESQRQAANERLRQAQQNLEEGRKVRYGNERNYARYLERIGKLEEEVNKAQQEVNNLNK